MTTTLREAPLRRRLVVTGINPASTPARRLAELGLRPGAVVQALRRTAGGGRILDIGGSRVALGYDLLPQIVVQEAAS